MTIDEAIEHAKEVARTCDDSQCAADHMQLAEWLRTARGAEKAARWYTARTQELEAENAKLRDGAYAMRHLYEDELKHALDENTKLRELCTDIWNDALHFEDFWDYVHDDGTIYREDELPHYQERMRECGIEVK